LQLVGGQVTVETAVAFAMIIAGLTGLALYVQHAMQGNFIGTARFFGLQFNPQQTYTETHVASVTETVTQISDGGMIEADLIPSVPPSSDFQSPSFCIFCGGENPDRLLSSLPTGPVPREPAFQQSEDNAGWTTTRSASYDSQP